MASPAIAQLLGAGGGAAWDPLTSIGWHSVHWANDPDWSNPGDGNAVSTWPNRGTSAAALDQGTGANQPLFRSTVAAYNNRSAVQGDGTNDYLESTFTTLAQTLTVVVVGNFGPTGPSAYAVLFDSKATSACVVYQNTVPTATVMASGVTSLGNFTSNTSPHLYVAKFAGASSTLEVDGTQVLSGDAGSGSLTSGLTIMDARTPDSATCHDGHYAYVAVYAGALSAGDLLDLETWVSDYYGITI